MSHFFYTLQNIDWSCDILQPMKNPYPFRVTKNQKILTSQYLYEINFVLADIIMIAGSAEGMVRIATNTEDIETAVLHIIAGKIIISHLLASCINMIKEV